MKEEVRLAVQAALLDSECSPQEAVQAALEAVAEFYLSETNGDSTDLVDALSTTYAVQEKSIRA